MSRLAARRLTPEILDSLPPSDRCAIGSRRDLVRLNWIMRQDVIMAKLLRSAARPPREILDLGAGDGRFMLRVARRLAPASPPVVLTLLDRHDLVSDATRSAFTALGWRIETVRAHALAMLNAASQDRYDAITANLFLHHFDRDVLFELLGAAASRTRLFCATEPRRDFLALMGSRMVWALGCNDVSATMRGSASRRASGIGSCRRRGRTQANGLWTNERQGFLPMRSRRGAKARDRVRRDHRWRRAGRRDGRVGARASEMVGRFDRESAVSASKGLWRIHIGDQCGAASRARFGY